MFPVVFLNVGVINDIRLSIIVSIIGVHPPPDASMSVVSAQQLEIPVPFG
jgi:hypothetical protein